MGVVERRERNRERAIGEMGEKGGRRKSVVGVERAREERRRGVGREQRAEFVRWRRVEIADGGMDCGELALEDGGGTVNDGGVFIWVQLETENFCIVNWILFVEACVVVDILIVYQQLVEDRG
ncbi:Uncharacterized protein Adt_08430 [Abeliophyllum distichum]|uniref:Uncharacterized protein n=1 Tax=Abeliophyllum distichum TaxID=126358 RepID=A0ABD1VCK0_9LAMI